MSVDPATFETKDMRLERLERELRESNTERDALRIIASDHLAGSNLTVKAVDAADVARWVAHPHHVRHLLKRDPLTVNELDDDVRRCRGGCDAGVDGTQLFVHGPSCPTAAAWRALGDPRGQEDTERAWVEASREHVRLGNLPPKKHKRTRRAGESVLGSFEKGSEEVSLFTDEQLDTAPRNNPCPCTTLVISSRNPGQLRCGTCGLWAGGWVPEQSDGLTGDEMERLYGRPYRLASESQQAAQERAIRSGGVAAGAEVAAGEAITTAINASIEQAFTEYIALHGMTIDEARNRLSRTIELLPGGLSRNTILDEGRPVWRIDATLRGTTVEVTGAPL